MLSMTFESYKGSKSKDSIGDNGSRWLLFFYFLFQSLCHMIFLSWELLYGGSSLGDEDKRLESARFASYALEG